MSSLTKAELLARYADGERDFRGSNLSGANLSCADLSRANLSGADLSCVNLCGAILCDANLDGAQIMYRERTVIVRFEEIER